MTVGELIDILRQYERELGSDTYVSLADYNGVIGDAVAVGVDDNNGDIIISPD